VVTIIAEDSLGTALVQALSDVEEVERCGWLSPGDLDDRSDLIFLQLPPGIEGGPVPYLGALLKRAPWLPVVPVLSGNEDPRVVLALGSLGVTDALSWPNDNSPETWRRIVVDHTCAAVADLLYRRLAGADSLLRDALTWATRHAHLDPSVDDLAKAVGVSRRHVSDFTQRTPRQILTLGRVIQAAHRLKITSQSVERIALAVGFSSGSGLRRALDRHLGVAPSSLREVSPIQTIVRELRSGMTQGSTVVH